MKKFTLGVVAGMSSLALTIPVLAQVSSAASGNASSAVKITSVPTQGCVQALVAKDEAFLGNIDAMTATHKTALLAHKNALSAAAALTDDTARQTAVQKAQTDFHTAMKTAKDSQPTGTLKTVMEAVRTACGKAIGMKGMGGMFMEGPGGKHGRGELRKMKMKLQTPSSVPAA